MAYEVLWAEDIDRDLELIFDFLAAATESFGESNEDAFNRAVQRSAEIEAEMKALGNAPHQGTLRPHLGDAVRNVTKNRAVYYFEVDDTRQVLRILAVFFGGQDHKSHVLLRLLGPA